MIKKYDVIIAGASFAGLAVASKIKSKVLLIDKQISIKEGQEKYKKISLKQLQKYEAI